MRHFDLITVSQEQRDKAEALQHELTDRLDEYKKGGSRQGKLIARLCNQISQLLKLFPQREE